MSVRTLVPITLFTLTVSSASFAVAQDGELEPFSMTMSIITLDSEMAQVEAVFPTHTKETERITS